MTFNACTKDDAGHGVGTEDPAQVITLTVSNTNSSSTARAGRPMLGSEAKHSIENIVVYIVDASTKEVKYTKDITNWQSNSSEYDNGRTTDFVLETKLDDGNYRIFAVGYHSDSSYSSNDIKGALVSGSTFNENAVLSLATDGGAEEIFAGSTESIPVEKSKGFKQKVILNRQVAGVYVYAKDVPYIADATQLRLVGSNEHNRLVLGQFDNTDLQNNGTDNSVAKAVINGFTESSAFDKTLLTIDLNDWFSSIEASGNLINVAHWKKPEKYNGKATFEKGAVFGGEFIIPFAKTGSEQTLKLQLTTAGGEVKREWNVNLPSSQTSTTYTLYTWNSGSSAFTQQESVQEDANAYNIVRNHLYGLRKRTTDDPGHGTDTEPTPGGDDEPVSLNNKHEVELALNGNWDVIHDMELD